MCKKLKGERWTDENCAACLPSLMEENADAARIYLLCRNQVIMSMNGPIDINHLAIHEAMRLYKTKDRQTCFEKVIALSNHFIEKYQLEKS